MSRIVDGETHLDDVELELSPGGLYVLLGATRSGKTSLLRVMAGLDRPTAGRILVDGQDVTGMHVRKRDVAMVYQQFVNYPEMTVYENIASPLRLRGLEPEILDQRVRHVASQVHVDHLLQRFPRELSGGQQQRCAIARALVKESALLLLDEPLANLDYKLREELRGELETLFEQREAIIVYATTEPSEALMLGGEVLIMHEGRVLQMGPTTKVYHRPGSLRVAATFSDPPMNFVDAVAEGGVAHASNGLTIPLNGHLREVTRGPLTLGARPCDLRLRPHDASPITVDGVVELAEISGSETFVHLRIGTSRWVVQEEGVHDYAIGSHAVVHLDPADLYAFGDTGALEAAPHGCEV